MDHNGLSRRRLIGGIGAVAAGVAAAPAASLAQEPADKWSPSDLLACTDPMFDGLAYASLYDEIEALDGAFQASTTVRASLKEKLLDAFTSNVPADARVVLANLEQARAAQERVSAHVVSKEELGRVAIAKDLADDPLYTAGSTGLIFLETAATLLGQTGNGGVAKLASASAALRADAQTLKDVALRTRNAVNAYVGSRGRVQSQIKVARAQTWNATWLAAGDPPRTTEAAKAIGIAINTVKSVEIAPSTPEALAAVREALLDLLVEGVQRRLTAEEVGLIFASTEMAQGLDARVWTVLREVAKNASDIHRRYITWSLWFFSRFLSRPRRVSLMTSQLQFSVPRLELLVDARNVAERLVGLL